MWVKKGGKLPGKIQSLNYRYKDNFFLPLESAGGRRRGERMKETAVSVS